MCWLPGQLAGGQHKSGTKINFFFKKNVVSHTTFAGRPTKMARLIVCTSFILEPPYLAIRTSLYISLIIWKFFLIQIKIFCVTDCMCTQYNVVTLLMIIDKCCINLVNVVTVLNVLLNNCCIWFIVLTIFEVILRPVIQQ